jgi:hypothetical protein
MCIRHGAKTLFVEKTATGFNIDQKAQTRLAGKRSVNER